MPENRYSGDVFGKKIADSTANNADIAGHYPYSPERWRFFETDLQESNRIFLEYSDDSRYAHQGFNGRGSYDVHELTPVSGDTLYFKTAERFRYVVGYESVPTMAISTNQALQDGDEIIIGPTDFTNGYGFRFNSTLGPNQCEFLLYRSGSTQNTKTINLSTPLTEFTRFEWRYAWYNIMGALGTQSYDFKNVQLGYLKSKPTQRGPEIGNFPISCKITAGADTDNLRVDLGSSAWQTKGDIESIVRDKTFKTGALTYSGAGEWQPLYVIRKAENRNYIQSQIDQINLTRFSGNGDAVVIAMAMSNENVRDSDGNLLDDTDFSVPAEISSTNSIFEVSAAVGQIPDNNGQVTATTPNPGGYQVGYSSLYETTGSGPRREGLTNTVKRKLHDNDYIVILGRSDVSGDMTTEILTEQSW